MTMTNPLVIDSWWMIATGRFIAQTHTIPAVYPFTYGDQIPGFVDAQWLAQLLYYAPYPLLGYEGVVFFNALIVTAAFALLMRVAWILSHNVAVAAACITLAVLFTLNSVGARAQNLAFLYFALTAWALWPIAPDEPPRSAARRLAAIGVVEILWANSHGSFFLGPTLSGLLLFGLWIDGALYGQLVPTIRSPRSCFLAITLVVQLVATLVTPFGTNLYSYAGRLVGNPVIRSRITEWMPTRSDPAAMFVCTFTTILVIAVVVLSWRRYPPSSSELLVLIGFGALAQQAVRNVVWWEMASTPILAAHLARVPLPASVTLRRADPAPIHVLVPNAILLVALLGAALSFLPWLQARNPLVGPGHGGLANSLELRPVVAFLQERPSCGRMFTPQWWSGYLNWELWPHCQTMIDIPVEVFTQEALTDFLAINQGAEGWEAKLDRDHVDVLLLSRISQDTLIQGARQSPSWKPVHEDDVSVVFVRTTSS